MTGFKFMVPYLQDVNSSSQKGISPLIAAVLLIAFTMAAAGLFSQWAPNLLEDIQEETSEDQRGLSSAASSSIDIAYSKYDPNSGNVSVAFRNRGEEELSNFTVTAYGDTPVQKEVDETLGSAEIATVKLETSGKPERIEVSHQSLPISDEFTDFESGDTGNEDQNDVSAPEVKTLSAVGVNSTNATLRGNVVSTGGETPDVQFKWGADEASLDNTVEIGAENGEFSEKIVGLKSSNTYYFQAEASNSAGADTGSTENFTTSSVVIDGFEDGDRSEYTVSRGSYDVQNTISYNGSYALHTNSDSRSDIYSTSGLNAYPRPGDTFSIWLRQDAHSSISVGFGGTGPRDWNVVNMVAGDNTARIQVMDSSSTTTLASASPTLSYGEWYKFTVSWGEQGQDMNLVVQDSDGTELANISASDSTHNTGGIIGFESWGGSGGEDRYMDYIVK